MISFLPFAVFITLLAQSPAVLPAPPVTPQPVTPPAVTQDPSVWKAAESAQLTKQTQLTFPEQFVKAGEAYFSPEGNRIIFQAVEQPENGQPPADFYSMYVADLAVNAAGDPALKNIQRVSPPGSANTCGWFDASRPNTVVFGSTLVAPKVSDAPGYQRGTGRYKWQFPPEMRVVEVDLTHAAAIAAGTEQPKVLAGDGLAYTAECTTSVDGVHLLFCTLAQGAGGAGGAGDLAVKNLQTGKVTSLVAAQGYDGGPFFSPDERQLCYRSDRNNDSLLQVFICDIVRDESGAISGTTNERKLTDNAHVNWAPYWHPTGLRLVYASSEVGHTNYEIFSVEAPTSGGGAPPTRTRVTQADGADVLPVFNANGSKMMWTSQRGAGRSSQLWIADVVTAHTR